MHLRQMKNRNISKDDILDTLNDPEGVKKNSHGNIIVQKTIEKQLLRVFYFLDGNSKVVITTYKTSKIHKYL